MSLAPSLKLTNLRNTFTVNIFFPYLRLTVKIFQFLRLSSKFLAVLRLSVTPLKPSTNGFPAKWHLRNERRNFHTDDVSLYLDLGRPSDWLKQFFNQSEALPRPSVWYFCARSTDVLSGENQQWLRCLSGYFFKIWVVFISIVLYIYIIVAPLKL